MTNDDSATGEIGYGRPPREHQFKKGKSGNPKGRPRKAKQKLDFRAALERALAKSVTVQENNETRQMPSQEAWVKAALARSFKSSDEMQAMARMTGAAAPPKTESGIKCGVLVIPQPMTVEEWYAYWSAVPLPPPDLEYRYPGMNAEAMHRAREEKRRLVEVGYDDSADEL